MKKSRARSAVIALPQKGHPAVTPNVPAAQAAPAPSVPAAALKQSVDVQWSCKTLGLGQDGKPTDALPEQLTVGKKFWLECEGGPVKLEREQLHLVLPKDTPFSLRILEVKNLGEAHAQFIATSWTAAEVKLENPILTDGNNTVGLGKIELQVASVITPENNPEKKPYGPFDPAMIAWPIYVWLIIAFLVGAVLCAVALLIRKAMSRRRLLADLAAHPIAVSPYHHFNKEIRTIARAIPSQSSTFDAAVALEFVTDLDRAFRWFLARELVVSAISARPKAICKELRTSHAKLFDKIGKELTITLNELVKAKASSAKLSLNDAQQLLELARSLADRIAEARKEKGI